eukprot:4155534-Pleurochrysis_carterae.AAC.1
MALKIDALPSMAIARAPMRLLTACQAPRSKARKPQWMGAYARLPASICCTNWPLLGDDARDLRSGQVETAARDLF